MVSFSARINFGIFNLLVPKLPQSICLHNLHYHIWDHDIINNTCITWATMNRATISHITYKIRCLTSQKQPLQLPLNNLQKTNLSTICEKLWHLLMKWVLDWKTIKWFRLYVEGSIITISDLKKKLSRCWGKHRWIILLKKKQASWSWNKNAFVLIYIYLNMYI